MMKLGFASLFCILFATLSQSAGAVTITTSSTGVTGVASPGYQAPSVGGSATNNTSYIGLPTRQVVSTVAGDGCFPTSVTLCGQTFSLPGQLIGGQQLANMPDQFIMPTALYQCVYASTNAAPFWLFTGNLQTQCALKSCAPTNVSVCDYNVPIRDETAVGDQISVTVPAELVSDTYAGTLPSFTAQCVNNNGIHYQTDTNSIPCTIFACQPSELDVCQAKITVKQKSNLGTVFSLTASDGQPVTVQCMGTEGRAPQYQVIDHNPCY